MDVSDRILVVLHSWTAKSNNTLNTESLVISGQLTYWGVHMYYETSSTSNTLCLRNKELAFHHSFT